MTMLAENLVLADPAAAMMPEMPGMPPAEVTPSLNERVLPPIAQDPEGTKNLLLRPLRLALFKSGQATPDQLTAWHATDPLFTNAVLDIYTDRMQRDIQVTRAQTAARGAWADELSDMREEQQYLSSWLEITEPAEFSPELCERIPERDPFLDNREAWEFTESGPRIAPPENHPYANLSEEEVIALEQENQAWHEADEKAIQQHHKSSHKVRLFHEAQKRTARAARHASRIVVPATLLHF